MSKTSTDGSLVMEDDAVHDQLLNAPDDTPPCADLALASRIEALLLSSDRPMNEAKIAELLQVESDASGAKVIREAIDQLNAAYDETGRSFRIEAVAGGRQLLTLPAFGPVLHRLHQDRLNTRLSPAAMETLAIVAYRQPILRADIEAIRGVACGEVLRGLMERRLVKIVGRAEDLGRPMLYGTTREFLRVFGLASLDDLPNAQGLREPASRKPRTKQIAATASSRADGPGDESNDAAADNAPA